MVIQALEINWPISCPEYLQRNQVQESDGWQWEVQREVQD